MLVLFVCVTVFFDFLTLKGKHYQSSCQSKVRVTALAHTHMHTVHTETHKYTPVRDVMLIILDGEVLFKAPVPVVLRGKPEIIVGSVQRQ